MGRTGLVATLEILDGAGVGHTGTAGSADERRPTLIEVQGVTVAHLSFTYGTNGIPSPEPWSVNRTDPDRIIEDAAWARDHGAEFVILSLHWGAEYQPHPTGDQIRLAETLAAAPEIDLILGHHAHVIQPIVHVAGKVVVYGMGNQLSNIRGSGYSRSGAEDGIIVHLEVTEIGGRFRITDTSYTPTWVDPTTKQVVPVEHALATGIGSESVLRASLARTIERVTMFEELPRTAVPWPEASCRGVPATMVGTRGPDTITGGEGPDVIVGRFGNDAIWGGGGDDLICGGRGDDVIRGGDGADTLQGGRGSDRLHGDAGDDRLIGGRHADVIFGGYGEDRLQGGRGADLLYGNLHGDRLQGGAGDDRLSGGPGDDTLAGGIGGDDLRGDLHDDRLDGGAGDDDLQGGAGTDVLDGGDGEDRCRGGETAMGCTLAMQ
jgi:Ca2+-binding RTX toxin-like protein